MNRINEDDWDLQQPLQPLQRVAAIDHTALAYHHQVVHGAKLGKQLGFPTANIPLRQRPPLSGIYVVQVENVGPGVASVGYRPTVNPVRRPLLEVHLLERGGELYGKRLRVRFLRKLRDEEKYDDLAALREAIARDAAQAREYFARHG